MKTAVYHGAGEVRLEERDAPEPGPGEVLVAMRACGICGSDLMEWYLESRVPLVLGHEPAGVVVATGEPLGAALPAPGDRVFVHHHVPCGECEYCHRGYETLCDTFKATRIHPGGFSELILELYGAERGGHSRSAVGMAELPFDLPVEIEAEVEDER